MSRFLGTTQTAGPSGWDRNLTVLILCLLACSGGAALVWAADEGHHDDSGNTRAQAHQWIVEHRTAHTYPAAAVRMLEECGRIADGICIDVGCGAGRLDVELAKRSRLKIIGLDIDPDVKPLFERTIRQAGL